MPFTPKSQQSNVKSPTTLSITKVLALINKFNAPCAAYGAQYCAVIGSISLFTAMCFGFAAPALAHNCAGHWVVMRGFWCRTSGQLGTCSRSVGIYP